MMIPHGDPKDKEIAVLKAVLNEVLSMVQELQKWPLASRNYRPCDPADPDTSCGCCETYDPFNDGDPLCFCGLHYLLSGVEMPGYGMQETFEDWVCDEFQKKGQRG